MTPAPSQSSVGAIYEALSSQDHDRAREYLRDDVLLLNVATGDVYRGQSGFLEYFRGWSVAFPDLRLAHLKIAEYDARVTVEYELKGTHTGPLVTRRGHLPPTAMEVQLRVCDVLELSDGKVAHVRTYFDSASLLRQLGLLSGTPLHAPERRAPLELYAQPVQAEAPFRNKALVQRYLQDVFNRQNPAAVADTCGRGFAWHGGSLGEARGLAEYQNVLAAFFAAFPDLQIEILDALAEGDRVAVRYAMSGTHLGDFQGIAPTFKRVAGGGTNTYRLDETRIVEEWWQGDILVLLQQMDAAPPIVRIGS